MKKLKRIYLDANGSCPALPEAKEKLNYMLDLIGNPSSSHDHGRVLRALIDEARYHVASAIDALPKELIFTSGASESNRWFFDALVKRANDLNRPLNVLISPFEHPSLYKPIFGAHEEGQLCVSIMALDKEGKMVLPDKATKNCDVMIICQAHNETGILPDIEKLIPEMGPDVLIMSDISQAFARLDPLPKRVDIMTFSAQKMGGFAGAGGIIIRGNGKKLLPPWTGGGQERGFRPGTESSLLLGTFGEAAKHARRLRATYREQVFLRNHLESCLYEVAPIKVIGQALARLPNTSAVSFLAEDPDALRIACDLAGLSVGFGAACSGLAPEGSFALKRLGLSLTEERATVRFSLPHNMTLSDIDEAIGRLKTRVLTRKFPV